VEAALDAFEPEVFGKYYLVDRVATGGMAEVFKAKTFAHGGFESLFVIKRILPALGADPEFVDMFVEEAKVSVVLQHPNVVRVFDFGKEGEHFYIAMEHVAGKDLRRVMRAAHRRREAFPARFAAYVAAEACKGLHHAHTRASEDGRPMNIVHRDVSPSNLLISYDGGVKVVDFGIAKVERETEVTDAGVIKGKYEYMSPEQAIGGEVDRRSDIFSLGVCLFEMLTGVRAFKGESDAETLKRIREVQLAPPIELDPNIPRSLDAVVRKAVARDPAERFQSAREMGEALRRALEPLTDDELHEELGAWMKGLFATELVEERSRLEAGSELASRLHQLLEAKGGDARAAQPPQSRLFGVLIVALLAIVGVLGAVSWLSLQQPDIPEVHVAASGSLVLELSPKAKVFVGGRQVGEGTELTVEGLAPGEHRVRVEAEGFRPVEEVVRITRGGSTVFQRTLEGWGLDAPAVEITSNPSGATVKIGGEEVGKTPLTWRAGEPGGSYQIELGLAGHEPYDTRVSELVERETRKVSARLRKIGAVEEERPRAAATPRPSAASGTLRVVLMGATWANVFVDDVKLSQTAPFAGIDLPAGRHTVRVVNTALGLDHTQEVTVIEGAQATVRALAH
jgi:hypothetical protein